MQPEEAIRHVGEVAERIGAPLRSVRIEPLKEGAFPMCLREGELTLGPALVTTLGPESPAYAVVVYLKGPLNVDNVRHQGPLFVIAFLLSLTAALAVFHVLGPTLAAFLISVPLTLAALAIYSLLLLVPHNEYRMRVAIRQGLRIGGLAGAEEYVTKVFRFSLGGQEPVERVYGNREPSSQIARLRKTARRMGLA